MWSLSAALFHSPQSVARNNPNNTCEMKLGEIAIRGEGSQTSSEPWYSRLYFPLQCVSSLYGETCRVLGSRISYASRREQESSNGWKGHLSESNQTRFKPDLYVVSRLGVHMRVMQIRNLDLSQ